MTISGNLHSMPVYQWKRNVVYFTLRYKLIEVRCKLIQASTLGTLQVGIHRSYKQGRDICTAYIWYAGVDVCCIYIHDSHSHSHSYLYWIHIWICDMHLYLHSLFEFAFAFAFMIHICIHILLCMATPCFVRWHFFCLVALNYFCSSALFCVLYFLVRQHFILLYTALDLMQWHFFFVWWPFALRGSIFCVREHLILCSSLYFCMATLFFCEVAHHFVWWHSYAYAYQYFVLCGGLSFCATSFCFMPQHFVLNCCTLVLWGGTLIYNNLPCIPVFF